MELSETTHVYREDAITHYYMIGYDEREIVVEDDIQRYDTSHNNVTWNRNTQEMAMVM